MKRKIFWTVGTLILLWLIIPTADNVTPDWTVFITDTEGNPLSGTSVTVFSQQYTLESSDTEDTQVTSENGLVHFKERRIYAPGIMRLLGAFRNLDQGVHASFGVYTYLHADKKGYGDPSKLSLFGQNERESRANGSNRQYSHLVLLRCSPGYGGIGCSFPDDPEKPILPLAH